MKRNSEKAKEVTNTESDQELITQTIRKPNEVLSPKSPTNDDAATILRKTKTENVNSVKNEFILSELDPVPDEKAFAKSNESK